MKPKSKKRKPRGTYIYVAWIKRAEYHVFSSFYCEEVELWTGAGGRKKSDYIIQRVYVKPPKGA